MTLYGNKREDFAIRSLVIQISLNIPNQWGHKQLLMENINDKPVLAHIIKAVSDSKKIDAIYILTSNQSIDDDIYKLITTDFIGNKIPVKCVRLTGEGNFLKTNIKRNPDDPGKLLNYTGMYNTDCFFKLCEDYKFETVILLPCESAVNFNGNLIDEMIDLSDNKFSFTGLSGIPIFILPVGEVKNAFQETRSEIIQSYVQKLSQLKNNNASKMQLEFFENLHKAPLTIFKLLPKIQKNISLSFKNNHPIPGLNWVYNIRYEVDLYYLKLFFSLFSRGRESVINKTPEITDTLKNLISEFDGLNLKQFEENEVNATHVIIKALQSGGKNSFQRINENGVEKILDMYKFPPAILTIDYLNADLNEDNVENLIKKAKEHSILCIQIKTSGESLTPEMLIRLQKEGLNGLVLNLDQIQNRENIFEIIDKFTNLKSDSNTFSDFLIYAQISFNSDTQNLIREIFKKYEFILDKIIVLPAKDNKNEVLNLSDVKQNYGNNCSWALHTHVYDAESNLLLCEETALQKWDFNKASIQDINNSRGVMPVCNSCKMKTRLNGFYDTKNLFIQNSCNHKSLLLNLIFNEIADYYFSEHNYGLFEYKKNIEKLSELGMLPEFFSTKKVLIIYTAGKLIALKRFDDALYLLELILKFDPSNPEIHDILEKLSESL